jgi:hypothetical protein
MKAIAITVAVMLGIAALLKMFGGLPSFDGITRARFENLAGQGVVLDNIRAIPEPSALLPAALGALLTGARNSFRPKPPVSSLL